MPVPIVHVRLEIPFILLSIFEWQMSTSMFMEVLFSFRLLTQQVNHQIYYMFRIRHRIRIRLRIRIRIRIRHRLRFNFNILGETILTQDLYNGPYNRLTMFVNDNAKAGLYTITAAAPQTGLCQVQVRGNTGLQLFTGYTQTNPNDNGQHRDDSYFNPVTNG